MLSTPDSEAVHMQFLEDCAQGRAEAVKRAVTSGTVNLRWRSPDGITALHRAATYDAVSVVRVLLEAGADVLAQDNTASTPLHYAAANGAVDSLCAMGMRVPSVEVSNVYGYSPFHAAILASQTAAALTLLELFRADIHSRNGVGMTPLHSACQTGAREAVTFLLSRPSLRPNLRDNKGLTPLMRALQAQQPRIVRALLQDPRVDVAMADNHGRTVLHHAAELGLTSYIEMLEAHCPTAVCALINQQDHRGQTALHVAVQQSEFMVSFQLMSMGADSSIEDQCGQSAALLTRRILARSPVPNSSSPRVPSRPKSERNVERLARYCKGLSDPKDVFQRLGRHFKTQGRAAE